MNTSTVIRIYKAMTSMSNVELATMYNRSLPTISNWCTGKTEAPATVVLDLLSRTPEIRTLIFGDTANAKR